MKNWSVYICILYYTLAYNTQTVNSQVAPAWQDFVEAQANGTQSILPDYSYSGYHFSEKAIPDVSNWEYFDVTDYGAIPNDGEYDDDAIQATIDAAEEFENPAVVFFPAGRFMVSNDNNIANAIRINGDYIVLKGSGSGAGGTEIFMDQRRVSNGHWQFRFNPASTNTSTLTSLTEPAKRGDFEVTVESTADLSVGQNIFINHQSEEFARAHYDNLDLNTIAWTRLFGGDGGLIVYECHKIESINGNKVKFKNPVQIDMPTLSKTFDIRNLKTIEEVGIEDILFSSGWINYEGEFVHHQNAIVDYGWNAVQFKFVENAWIRNCEFKDWTQVADIRESIGVTIENCVLTGKRGHASFITRRNYGVLVKDCVDNANHHHGPGTGYSGVSTVYLRYQMNEDQSIDCHSGSPFTTLMDDIEGGDFHTNGGPHESYPHHARFLTFWNFVHKSSTTREYQFWSVYNRQPATYAEPFFIGFQPNNEVIMQDMGLNEMQGVEVEPKSLFEAQLALRLSPTSTEDNLKVSNQIVKIYPNPFSTGFQIQIEDAGAIESLSMISIDGREVAFDAETNSEGVFIRPQSHLSSGVYFIEMSMDGEVRRHSVVKE